MKPHLLSFSLALFVAALSQLAAAQSSIPSFGALALDRPQSQALRQSNPHGGKTSDLSHQPPETPGLAPGEVSEVQIRLRGDSAVVTGWFVTPPPLGGRPGTRGREPYHAVWVRRRDGWHLAAEQPSQLPRK